MGSTPNRRQEWLVRLVLYPAAIALIALWWHQHQARADDDGVRPAVRVIRLAGATSQGWAVTTHVAGRRPTTIQTVLRFTYPDGSARDGLALDYRDVVTTAGAHVVTDTRLDRAAVIDGQNVVAHIRSDSRAGVDSWRGTITARRRSTASPVARGA
jgi:hypothetical protein